MRDRHTLTLELRALSGAGALPFVAPREVVTQRLERIRQALRRQPVLDPSADYLLMCVGAAEQWVPLTGDSIVGLAPDATIHPPSRFISAHHCRLAKGPEGWSVQDLGSKNGVRVNGQRVDRCALRNGDAIELADVIFLLVGDGCS